MPALMAAAIAYAWFEIYKEWLEDAAANDNDLRRIYESAPLSEVPDKGQIFMENLGYIPR